MTAVLTRDQADLLICYGAGWKLGDIIRNPDGGISEAKAAMSGAATGEWWWDTDGKGIHATRTIGRDSLDRRITRPVELTWTEIRRAVAAIPARLRYAVVDASKEHRRQINHRVPPYLPGGYAPFVYPDPAWERDAHAALRAACIAAVEAVAAGVDPDGVPGQLHLFAVAS